MELTFRLGLKNPFIIMGSILGTYLSVIFWLAGFKYTSAGRAAIYNELSFILIIIMASVFLKESMTKRKLVAVVIAVIGALIVSFN
jgi:drug/metabolite transporter (DMT)-like permease